MYIFGVFPVSWRVRYLALVNTRIPREMKTVKMASIQIDPTTIAESANRKVFLEVSAASSGSSLSRWVRV